MKQLKQTIIPLNCYLFFIFLSLFWNSVYSAGHISSIQTNVDYINFGYAKTFEFLFRLEHDLPITACMKIRLPFLVDDGTSKLIYFIKIKK